MISKEKFIEIINYFEEWEANSDKIDNIVREICIDFPPLNLFGLAIKWQEYVIELLKDNFNLHKTEDVLDWWIYETR